MEETRYEELHKQYFSLIPLFQKCKILYSDKDRPEDLCSKNQVMAIMVIGKAKSITPTELSMFINMEKGSLTTLIDSLEEKGLAARHNDPKDRRKTLLSLTAEGENYMIAFEEQSKKVLRSMIACLDENEIVEMHTSMGSLVKILLKIAHSA